MVYRRSTIAASAFLLGATLAVAGEPKWKAHTINARSEFEAAGAFDVNGDGKIDVVSGDTWYEAPNWTPHHVRDLQKIGTYYNCFASLPMDVNGDGRTDYVTVGYFSKNVGWVENPGDPARPWTYHEIDLPGPSECATLVDLTGDGRPEVLPNTVNVVVWYELEKAANPPVWKKHDLGAAGAGHGVGSGDVNGDGRIDLLTPKGWFEAPADPRNGTWVWHPEWQLGTTGIQILARDVNGDGLADVVWGNGHDYGLFWLKQGKSAGGERTWTKGTIDARVATAHTLMWADLDGDGKAQELLTGKRVYAHEIEPGDTDASWIAWYGFDRAAGGWVKHSIFQGEAAKNAPGPKSGLRSAQKDFPPGTLGTGLQIEAVDLDHDGDIDLVCPGKSGLYWIENLGSH
jgi:hypothetical protein